MGGREDRGSLGCIPAEPARCPMQAETLAGPGTPAGLARATGSSPGCSPAEASVVFTPGQSAPHLQPHGCFPGAQRVGFTGKSQGSPPGGHETQHSVDKF